MVDVSLKSNDKKEKDETGKKVTPVMGQPDPQNRIGTSGPKGGGESASAKVKPGSKVSKKYNTDSSYGYYTKQGEYVPADIDMRDGGGMNASGTTYSGGGLLSALGNVLKVTPYGQENTPREQIGYRDITDMFDGGGPQASGGAYQGGGNLSIMGNLLDTLGGVDQGVRTPYVYDTPTPRPTEMQAPQRSFMTQESMDKRKALAGNMQRFPTSVMENIENVIENTEFKPPVQTMEQVRTNMAKEMLADKYGTAFFTFPPSVQQMEIQEVLRQMGTGF
tara:strand:- start:408 stop:1238 length:831 start_codon:yes stop_codon:yes gene_type:complete